MYLRHSSVRKGGKTYTYWRLVRSVRRGKKVIQQTVLQLGELDAEGRANAQKLAREMSGHAEQQSLFEPHVDGPPSPRVRLDRVRLDRSRSFGKPWLALQLWQTLQLDQLCERIIPRGREEVPWATMAAILVIARLCEPSSELHIAESWYRKTALEDLLGVPADVVNDDRLYRALDELLPHKEAIEKHLRSRLGELFGIEYDLLLYDVTSTYFEGEANRNPMAQQGHSRDHRPDCKQVCIALVVTRDGMPLGYELFDGNRADVTTVEEIVETMEERFGVANRVWVMDRGMTSEDNIEFLKEGDRQYILGTPRSELKRYCRQIADERDWKKVRAGIEVKSCPSPDGRETFLLCRSAARKKKETAMHARFAARIENGLESLKRRLEKSRRPIDAGSVERQIGRLLERNSRAAGRYNVRVIKDATARCGLRVSWVIQSEWEEWAALTEGCYILRTNVPAKEWTDKALWQAYTQLSDAEAAFRIQKSDLSIRPIWHQRADRVQAHILVCFLAYVLWKTLEKWSVRAGLGNSPRTIIDEMGSIQSADVVLPLAADPSKEIRIRCVVRPEKAQALLLSYLGLRVPDRLRAPTPTWRSSAERSAPARTGTDSAG